MEKVDVCLFLEGTYPYVPGGVSSWTHELIREQSELSFHIVALLPPGADTSKQPFVIPDNVVALTNVFLQELPVGEKALSSDETENLFGLLQPALLDLQLCPSQKTLRGLINALSPYRARLGSNILLDSPEAWDMLVRMYEETMPDTAFLDYFWSWRALLGGLYSVLLADLPESRAYHALCTGYAGLFLARAHIENGRPCIVTEHGIYTNERRIEIASADWLIDQKAFSLTVNKSIDDRELKDFWIDMFSGYSRLCYEVCSEIITLYEGNQQFQRMDGADPEKLHVIANGIDYARFSKIKRKHNRPPTIALIGRVVPIKDVKTFIHSVSILKEAIPELCAFIMGPTDEDPVYFNECVRMAEHMKLTDCLTFTGKVSIDEYLAKVDIIVLTSISEAQPLVVLEAGAAGIPCVSTDVGACREMIFGRSDERPSFGAGGAITPLSNPKAIAGELLQLFANRERYEVCSQAIQARVARYYQKEDQHGAYRALYDRLIRSNEYYEEAA